MKRLVILLLLMGQALAQQNCEGLIASIDTAFDTAYEVTMSTQIKQGDLEYAYTRMKLFKDAQGQWQAEQLEQRGIPRPAETRREGEGAEPSFAFSCAAHQLVSSSSGWELELQEQDKDLPIKTWQLSFRREQGKIVPLEISGLIDTWFLFIPFKGNFSTSFSNWQFED